MRRYGVGDGTGRWMDGWMDWVVGSFISVIIAVEF